MKRNWKKIMAFTLAEIMVVFGIIAVVSASTIGIQKSKSSYVDNFMYYAAFQDVQDMVASMMAQGTDTKLTVNSQVAKTVNQPITTSQPVITTTTVNQPKTVSVPSTVNQPIWNNHPYKVNEPITTPTNVNTPVLTNQPITTTTSTNVNNPVSVNHPITTTTSVNQPITTTTKVNQPITTTTSVNQPITTTTKVNQPITTYVTVTENHPHPETKAVLVNHPTTVTVIDYYGGSYATAYAMASDYSHWKIVRNSYDSCLKSNSYQYCTYQNGSSLDYSDTYNDVVQSQSRYIKAVTGATSPTAVVTGCVGTGPQYMGAQTFSSKGCSGISYPVRGLNDPDYTTAEYSYGSHLATVDNWVSENQTVMVDSWVTYTKPVYTDNWVDVTTTKDNWVNVTTTTDNWVDVTTTKDNWVDVTTTKDNWVMEDRWTTVTTSTTVDNWVYVDHWTVVNVVSDNWVWKDNYYYDDNWVTVYNNVLVDNFVDVTSTTYKDVTVDNWVTTYETKSKDTTTHTKALAANGTTLCNNLVDTINTTGSIDCAQIADDHTNFATATPNFTTSNGMRWFNFGTQPFNPFYIGTAGTPELVSADYANQIYTIYIDIDGASKGTNTITSDIMKFYISRDGSLILPAPDSPGANNIKYLSSTIRYKNGTSYILPLQGITYRNAVCKTGKIPTTIQSNYHYCDGISAPDAALTAACAGQACEVVVNKPGL